MKKRYLEVFDQNGSWIERPDLYLLARMAYPDTTEDADEADETEVEHLKMALAGSNFSTGEFSKFEADLSSRQVQNQNRHRVFAGEVLIELVRIGQATGQPPTTNNAISLVARKEYYHTKKSSVESIRREVEKGFSRFRNTCHLEASRIIMQEDFAHVGPDRVRGVEIPGGDKNLREFLGRARAFEHYFDANVAKPPIKWNPWRVPEQINPIYALNFMALSEEEKAQLSSSD